MRTRNSGEFTHASPAGDADNGSRPYEGNSGMDINSTIPALPLVDTHTQPRRSRDTRRRENMEAGIEAMFGTDVVRFDEKVVNYHRVLNGAVGDLGGQAMQTMMRDADYDSSLVTLAMAKDTYDKTSSFTDRISGRRRRAKHSLAEAGDRYQRAYEDNFTSTLGRLTVARAQVAEETHTGRQGRLVSKFSRNRHKLNDAISEYQDLRSLDFEESFDRMVGKNTAYAAKAQFRTSYDAHEDGALAGEEMQHYIAISTDGSGRSFTERTIDGYNNLSRKQKFMVMGAAAATGFAIGAVAGGAIAGLSFAGRFAKNYFTSASNYQAQQAEDTIDFSAMTDDEVTAAKNQLHRDRWQNASLYAGNYQQLAAEQPDLRKKHEDEDYFDASTRYVDTIFHQADETMFAERMDERHEKQMVLTKAMGKTALTIGGGAFIGYLAEVASDHIPVGDWVDSTTKWAKDNIKLREWFTGRVIPGHAIPDLSALQPPLPPVELPELPELPPISPEAYRLYGDYAGQQMGITIPEGSSIWQELEWKIGQEYPALPDDERERLTANIWAQLSIQNPDLDFSHIAAGTRLEVAL